MQSSIYSSKVKSVYIYIYIYINFTVWDGLVTIKHQLISSVTLGDIF